MLEDGTHGAPMAVEAGKSDISQAIKSAYELADKILSSDADYAESKIKYSAWISALATAGFGLMLFSHDKLPTQSWLSHQPKLVGTLFVSTCVLFLFAIASSALILAVSNRYLASFKSEKILVCQRAFVITNHVKAFLADAEVRLVRAGVPTAFISDKIFEDLAASVGGALIEMDYGSTINEPGDKDYAQEQVSQEFRLLNKMFKAIANNLGKVRTDRFKDEKLLKAFFLAQEVLVGLGYVALLILACPV
jgi:hypothetical protein